MELKDAILKRRSIRKYKSTPVSDEVLNELMELACWAPSGVNLQPWYFAVVRSPQQHAKIMQLMGTAAGRMKPMLDKRFPNHPEVAKETVSFIENVGGAPVIVLVFFYTDYDESQGNASLQSIGAAVENLCLAACDKGLGTCWMTAAHMVKEDLTREFGQGKGEFVAMVALGEPDEEARAPKRREGRFDLL
ncbi:nitroreductase family protein [Ruminococcaceae bacterium OttesenSCG-928-O06]|nr:nitroreductase family protein [Ruminococcaceae bacterium OttesenSCG-928-O06]